MQPIANPPIDVYAVVILVDWTQSEDLVVVKGDRSGPTWPRVGHLDFAHVPLKPEVTECVAALWDQRVVHPAERDLGLSVIPIYIDKKDENLRVIICP